MKLLLIICAVAFSATAYAEFVHTETCAKENPNGPFVYSSDFKWGYEYGEMKNRFLEIYASGKRLKSRAYWDDKNKKIMMPLDDYQGGDFEVSENFVKAIATHISEGFKYEYIDAVFFPDMGHSHFLIPLESWESKYVKYPVTETNKYYADLFKDPEIKILYHTAEQLATTEDKKPKQDRALQWRYHTRNLVGNNSLNPDIKVIQAKENAANTLHEIAGYTNRAGFNLSASSSGCFEYKNGGESFRFDLSLKDLQSENPDADFATQ